jgi:hypothetical protein
VVWPRPVENVMARLSMRGRKQKSAQHNGRWKGRQGRGGEVDDVVVGEEEKEEKKLRWERKSHH